MNRFVFEHKFLLEKVWLSFGTNWVQCKFEIMAQTKVNGNFTLGSF